MLKIQRRRQGFDHVWPILKDAEKWLDPLRKETTKRHHSDGYQAGSPISAPPGTQSSTDLNAGEDFQPEVSSNVDSSGRPTGIKKEKMRRMKMVDNSHILASMAEGNREIIEHMKRGQSELYLP